MTVFSGRWSLGLAGGFSVILAVVAFWPSLSNGFMYDDVPLVAKNPLVTEAGSWWRFWVEPWWPRGSSLDKLYRPLTMWSYRANAVLAGGGTELDPRSFRLTNLGLHALAALGVVLVGWRLTGSSAAGWISGSLFAVHPVHTEAVVTCYGRAEVLAGCLVVWLVFRYLRPPGAGRSWRWHLVNAVLLLAAVMSKEHAALIWPVLFSIDLWRWRRMSAGPRPGWRLWLNGALAPAHVGLVLALAGFFLLRYNVFGWTYVGDMTQVRAWEVPMAEATAAERLLTPFRLGWITLRVLCWPAALCPVWSVPATMPAGGLAADVVGGMVLVVGGVVLVGLCWRRGWLAGTMVLGGLVMMLIPAQALAVTMWWYAERWLYLPSVFAAVVVGVALARLGVAGCGLGISLAFLLLPSSWQYCPVFASDLAMNREVILRQPDSFQGRRNLALALYEAERYEEAIQAARECIERFNGRASHGPRFKPVEEPYWVLLKSYLALGDGARALEALDTYEAMRAHLPAPRLTEERRRALALITRASSRPAASEASGR
ncbi:MAG TPA: tetratricopeptide repeat protein [Phycisphaerae bacterium]|nr:tetratricopeptide repeat protein [Phycisphaerae bacterium]